MDINYQLLNELSHMLEMNGRQFILREAKIKEMKSTETYEVPHGNDLIYYSIKSGLIHSIQRSIVHYMELKNDGEGMEVALRATVESQYQALVDLGSHDDFMKAMDLKYSIKI